MKEVISSMMDGEAGDEEVARIMAERRNAKQCLDVWNEYHLIGDAMRGNSQAAVDVRAQVSNRLKDEPTILSPQVRPYSTQGRASVGLALAASVSLLALLAWQQLSLERKPMLVTAQQEPVPIYPVRVDDSYLFAHQEGVAEPSGNESTNKLKAYR